MLFGIERLINKFRKKNWLGETQHGEIQRRLRAVEIHVRQLALEQSQLYAKVYEGVIAPDAPYTQEELKGME